MLYVKYMLLMTKLITIIQDIAKIDIKISKKIKQMFAKFDA